MYELIILSLSTGVAFMLAFLATLWQKIAHQATRSKLEMTQQQLEESQRALQAEQEKHIKLLQAHAALEMACQELSTRLATQQQANATAESQLLLQFRHLAQELLETKSKQFTEVNKVQMEGLLTPLRQHIQAFEQQLGRTHHEALTHKVALRTELERINKLNVQLAREAENLTRALKGDQRTQGSWGEFILESLLEKSGLVKGREYFVQQSVIAEEGKRYQPDVVVKLPEGKVIVIDAKVSLLHYEQFFQAMQEEDKQLYLKKHLQAVREHIKRLSAKNYAQLYSLQGLDFVLLFMPIEPAFALSLQQDPTIFDHAQQQNIILTSPSTLMATLRTIAYVWKNEYQNQYALEIARQSGALYDKFVSFVEDLKKLGHQLQLSQQTYEAATRKLSEGRGNLISKAEQIRALGARTSKTLTFPQTGLPESLDQPSTE